ncbi:MAG: serine/threonine protein kinase [Thermoanaerobaculia bacterium]|nr:serine/threonine protein kinase [Thermoanaerobaculia bacterium]
MERLGKYEIVEKIGVGGFGVVYKGLDPFIKRPVAIKTCSAEDQETRDRFLREAEIAGNLQHRNIVTVFEFGFHEQTPYLVQEFLTGEDLDHKIRRGDAVPLATKVSWLVEIARGLAFAHEKGVVHRDIKPANVRVLDDGHVKILDFGIAKLAQQHSNLTQAGVTLGTASYLAPEQIRGERVDTRTDVFSFGVLAYELLTYEKPFRAQEISALFYKLLNEQPTPIVNRAPGTPPDLVRLVERCLAKDAARRFAPTGELLRALERIARPMTATSSVPRPPIEERTAALAAEPRTQAMAPRPRSVADEPTMTLDQLELRSSANESRGMAPAAGRPGGRWALAAGVVAVLGLGVGLGWLGRSESPTVPSSVGVTAATARPARSPAASAPQPAPPQAAPASGIGSPPAGAGGPPPAASTAAPAAAAPPPVVAPKPAAPKRARLVVGPAWDPAMLLVVGERRLRLDREQTLELPAGNASLQFTLTRPEYSAERSLRLQLKPGATERVSIPIERPGRLTVQPHLNARPGRARLDGQPVGATPVRGLWVAPGSHFLEIFGLAAEGEPPFSRTIEIRSGVETVVTFDLDGRAESLIRERPLASP